MKTIIVDTLKRSDTRQRLTVGKLAKSDIFQYLQLDTTWSKEIYIMSDPSMIVSGQCINLTNGTPTWLIPDRVVRKFNTLKISNVEYYLD